EAEGVEALSMRRLAERLGIRAPSIYKHLPDKRALENAVISAGFEEQAELFEPALAGGRGPPAAPPPPAPAVRARPPPSLSTDDRAPARPGGARAGRRGARRRPGGGCLRRRRGARAGGVGVRARHDDPRAQRPLPARSRSRRRVGARHRGAT